MKQKKVKVAAIKGSQNEFVYYMLNVKISLLKDLFVLEHYRGIDDVEKDGMQRIRLESEINKFAKQISTGFCPVPIWVNDREKSLNINSVPISRRHKEVLEITLNPKTTRFYIPDGGLRTLGFIKALQEYDVENNLKDFDVPICMTRLSKSIERRGFIDTNTNAKKIKRNHTAAILYQLAVVDGENSLRNQKEVNEAIAFGVTKRLNTFRKSPLFDMMRCPPLRKYYTPTEIKQDLDRKYLRAISEASFISYLAEDVLKPEFHRRYFSDCETILEKSEKLVGYLINYWQELRIITKELWETPRLYAFFDAVGIRALIILFAFIMEQINTTYNKPTRKYFSQELSQIPLLRKRKYWRSVQAVKFHPDFKKKLSSKNWENHRDFKGDNLINVSGKKNGTVIGEKMIEQLRIANEKTITRFKKAAK